MDLWKPLSLLLARDPEGNLIGALVAQASAVTMTEKGADLYEKIGATASAREIRLADERIKQTKSDFQTTAKYFNNPEHAQFLRQHGGVLARVIFPVLGGGATAAELTAMRMAEHVLVEEMAVQMLLVLLAFTLLAVIVQTVIWLFRLRNAAAVPILLLPPARELGKALLLGIALPMVVYWCYSRLPVIGGREYGWGYMWPRFLAELLLLFCVVYWLPVLLLRRYLRRRCDELSIPIPPPREEMMANLKVRACILGTIVLLGLILGTRGHYPAFPQNSRCPGVAGDIDRRDTVRRRQAPCIRFILRHAGKVYDTCLCLCHHLHFADHAAMAAVSGGPVVEKGYRLLRLSQ